MWVQSLSGPYPEPVDLKGSDLARLGTLKQSLISESTRMNETFLPCSPPLEVDKRPQVLSLSP